MSFKKSAAEAWNSPLVSVDDEDRPLFVENVWLPNLVDPVATPSTGAAPAVVGRETEASFTPIGTDILVNTNTADAQVSPRTVRLADGKYMVVWVGSITLPVTSVGGTIAGSYANADIRAQIFNADGSRSGGEFIVNTITAGGQLLPMTTQLSDGHVLVSWHDGVGPAGGTAETSMNTIRAQEFDASGVAVGSEFVLGNSNGRQHSVAATNDGGFVVTFQEGGAGGSFPAGNMVGRVFSSSNVQTASFIIDNTQLLTTSTMTAVEADGDILVWSLDRYLFSGGVTAWRFARYDMNGNELSVGYLPSTTTVYGLATLATGGHVTLATASNGSGQPLTLYAQMYSADGDFGVQTDIIDLSTIVAAPSITALSNGGFIVSWGEDSDPGSGVNLEIMARVYNAIGNPVGEAFQVNTITTLNQSAPSFAQLTDGDIIASWVDSSLLNGDTSGPGINMRRIDYDPTNHAPTAENFILRLAGVDGTQPVDIDPSDYDGFFGPDGYDADGDPLIVTNVSNATNGNVTLNADGTITLTINPGASQPMSFDYTISDGLGGFATARATVVNPSDFVTLRIGETALIDFLANDFYTPAPGETFTLSPPIPVTGDPIQSTAYVISTPSGPRISYDPLKVDGSFYGLPNFTSSYFNLLVGQTTAVIIYYYGTGTSGDVTVTLKGWMQQGGTGADNLVGTGQADHLSGGAGAAHTLTGGAGNDWYSVSAVGDVIVELANEGTDWVRSYVSTYTLPDNVENLVLMGGGQIGIGNAASNVIAINNNVGSQLWGMDGDDTLYGGPFAGALYGGNGSDRLYGGTWLDGGAGADIMEGAISGATYIVDNVGDVVVVSSNGGTDHVQTYINYALGNYIENLTLLGNSALIGTGNALANIITGNAAASTLNGGAGNDRLVVGAGSDGSTVNGGADTDTLALTGAVNLTSGSLSSIEAVELASGASLTITATQFNTGLAANTRFNGTGSLVINVDAPYIELYLTQLTVAVGSNVAFTVNGSAGDDIVKGVVNVANTLNGGDGWDFLRGGLLADTINGGDGNDKISGFGGADILTGGSGADQFRLLGLTDSGTGTAADRITDFAIGTDFLDFRLYDADAATAGLQNPGFSFIGNNTFSHTNAAEIRFQNSGGDLLVQVDVDGNGTADMEIVLLGLANQTLTGGDFLL